MNTDPKAIEAENRAVHAEADKIKTDLSIGADLVVDTGTGGGATPPPKQDPFEARKALFAKANAMHDRDSANVRADNASVEELVAAMEAESRGESTTVDDGSPAGGTPPAQEPITPPSQNLPAYVTLDYNGRSVRVARTDIERAGSEALYLRQRQADDLEADIAERAAKLEAEQARLRQQSEQLAARQAEMERLQAAGHDGSAQSPAERTDGQGRATRPGDAAADLDARSVELAAQIYSGQPADTAEAVKSLLLEIEQARREGERRLAEYKAQTSAPSPAPAPAPAPAPTIDPRWEAQRKAINEMGKRDFPELDRDPALCRLVSNEIQRLSAMPENAQRRAMDVAIEACENVQRQVGIDSRSAVRTMKQGLPVIPSAGGSAPAPAEEQPLNNQSYVELLAQRRRFAKT